MVCIVCGDLKDKPRNKLTADESIRIAALDVANEFCQNFTVDGMDDIDRFIQVADGLSDYIKNGRKE